MAQLHRWTLVLFWLLAQVVPNSAYGDHHFAHDISNKEKEIGRLEAGGVRAGIVTEEEATRDESGGYPGHAKRKKFYDEQEASAGESPYYDPNLAPQVNERFNAENLAGQIHEDVVSDSRVFLPTSFLFSFCFLLCSFSSFASFSVFSFVLQSKFH